MLEKSDLLLGTGLVGGIMRNNGRYTAAEEMIAMGAGELFQTCDQVATHRNLNFPGGHRHATLYDVTRIEPAVRRVLLDAGVQIRFRARVQGVRLEGGKMRAVLLKGAQPITGDAFVDATGSAGPPGNCTKYGEGCVMCVLRCPTFGGRVSLTALAGVPEVFSRRADGTPGAFSGSCKLAKDSLAPDLLRSLEENGLLVVPLPDTLRDEEKLGAKACQQYADSAFADNLVILDTGHAKLMSSYFPLDILRQVPGFERAIFVDPYAGGVANSVRFTALAPHDIHLQITGVDNLFAGGEKAGPLVGHTEAITTGALAGRNAVLYAAGQPLIAFPTTLAVGDAIATVTAAYEQPGGLDKKYTFSGAGYFKRMVELNLYTTDHNTIRGRVEEAGMLNHFNQPVAARALAAGD